MKRLDSFGFVLSASSAHLLSLLPRELKMEAALHLGLTRRSPRLPCNCLNIRRRRYTCRSIATLATYSLRKLSDEERLWLYNNAFRPDRQNTGRSILSSTLGRGSFHGYAIRCLSSCSVLMFSCFKMVCNFGHTSHKLLLGGHTTRPP